MANIFDEIEKQAGQGGGNIFDQIEAQGAPPQNTAAQAPMAPRDLTPEQVFPMSAGGMKDQFDTALGTLFTYSDDGVKNIWSKQLQESGVEHEWAQDDQGNDILRYKDRDGNWQQGYINAPGMSGADALKPAAAVGTFGTASNLLRAGGMGLARMFPSVGSKVVPAATGTATRRAALTGAEAGLTQAGVDEIAQQTGADVPVSERLTNAAIATGFGALAEPVSMFIGKSAGKLWNAVKGGPSAAKVDAAKKLVLGSVDDQTRSVLEGADDAYWRGITEHVDNLQSAEDLRLFAVSEAYRKEIPGFQVFKPYVTKNLDDWTEFDEAIRGGYGRDVQRQMGLAEKANERAVANRIETLKPGATGGAPIADDTGRAGGIISEGMRGRADDLWQQIDEAYAVAGGKQGGFVPQAGQYLDEKVAMRLQESNLLGRRGQLPPDANNAASALDEVQDIVSSFAAQGDDAARPLTFQEFEKSRQYLNTLRQNAKGADRAAVSNIIRSFDEWADDMLDMAMYHGDDAAIEAFKGARKLRAEYGSKFSPQDIRTRSGRKVQDAAGKVIEDIAELDLGPEQVVNKLFGNGKLGQNKQSVEILRRMEKVVGKDSVEWKAMQEAGYMRLFYDKAGRPRSPTQIVNEWDALSQGDGKYWASRLFGEQAMKDMGRFVSLLKRTQMPSNAYNASGPAMRKNFQTLWGRMAKLVARLKFPAISQWADNAVAAQADTAMSRAGYGAVAAPEPVFMPQANLRDAVTASGFAGAQPAKAAASDQSGR